MIEYIKKEDAIQALMGHFLPQTFCGEEVDQAKNLAESIIDSIPLENRLRWIPVSERLPEYCGTYLVTLVYEGQTWGDTCQWNNTFGGKWQDVINGEYRDVSNVVAWMPLPEPYKESEEE